jgi:hypothetical protein
MIIPPLVFPVRAILNLVRAQTEKREVLETLKRLNRIESIQSFRNIL